MAFKEGMVVGKFKTGKGGGATDVVFRYPKKSDAAAAMRFINRARKESDFLGMFRRETLETEKKFINDSIENMKKRRGLLLFVEAGGRIAGDASIRPYKFDASKHVGDFGIALLEDFTGRGIGKALTKRILALAKRDTRFEIVASSYQSKNRRSEALHKSFGFKAWGKFPHETKSRHGKYRDTVHAYKRIK